MKRATMNEPAAPREVLVVEDEPQMRALLTDNLEFEGYHVTAVESAEQAVDEVARNPVSLVLLDVMLPGMNGFALCERLRTRARASRSSFSPPARTSRIGSAASISAPTTTSASRSACAS